MDGVGDIGREIIKVPIQFNRNGDSVLISRTQGDRVEVIDNLLELIVFTPKGSFAADPDFGFEYWNHEYSNIHFRDFNNGMDGIKKCCQESVKKSLEMYEPSLKNVSVSIELRPIDVRMQRRKVVSRYEISVRVTGGLDNGLGIPLMYDKTIAFYMEPTVKQVRILER